MTAQWASIQNNTAHKSATSLMHDTLSLAVKLTLSLWLSPVRCLKAAEQQAEQSATQLAECEQN